MMPTCEWSKEASIGFVWDRVVRRRTVGPQEEWELIWVSCREIREDQSE